MRSSSEWNDDHDQPPARPQHALGRRERRRPARQAPRSRRCAAPGTCGSPDGSRRAAHARRARRSSASARGGADRRLVARAHDGAGDRAGMALLAERRDDGGEIALGGARHHVGGARPVAAHAHVERTVEAEGEAALGLVELHRGDAEIEHDAVDGVVAAGCARRRRDWRSGPRPASAGRRAPRPDRRRARSRCWSRSMPMTRQSAAARMARV